MSRAFSALLGALFLVTGLLSVPGASSTDDHTKCRYPERALRYSRESMRITFRFDLAACWRKSRAFKINGSLSRTTATDGADLVQTKVCRLGASACSFHLYLEHPAVEVAEYSAQVRFRLRDGTVRRIRLKRVCVSNELGTECRRP